MTSPELTGGAGFTYEDAVTALYLVALATSTTAPGVTPNVVTRVAQQQESFGEPLDDIIVDATAMSNGQKMRLSLQVKRAITISSAAANTDFRAAIRNAWATIQKTDFREKTDRVGIAVATVAEDTSRALNTLCAWARASDTAASFVARLQEQGHASNTHREIASALRAVATADGTPLSDEQLFRLASHLLLLRLDFLHIGSRDEANAIAHLQIALTSQDSHRAGDVWRLLCQTARDGAGTSAVHTAESIGLALPGWRFRSAPELPTNIRVLNDYARIWIDQQSSDITGIRIPRTDLLEALHKQSKAHRLTLVKGLPGAGKTALLLEAVRIHLKTGAVLLLAADRLSGRSWLEHAHTIGLSPTPLATLLGEIALAGSNTLFIDGIDRIPPEQRSVVVDLLSQLLATASLSDWRVVATSRDSGIEPLRSWLPPAILGTGGVGYVDVPNFTDDEAAALSRAIPALRPLLIGSDERVRTLARRPFFAAVLARALAQSTSPQAFTPQSEIDLVDAWWSRGGYNSDRSRTLARQRALIELARIGIPTLGRGVRLRDVSAATQDVLPALEEDGLLRQVHTGHAAQFSHDIFFEWSLLHYFQDQGDEWIRALAASGEPPALARVVELLSQATYSTPAQWTNNVAALDSQALRPQWLRVWLLAPISAPFFEEQLAMYKAGLSAREFRLLGKLLVWIQAEKTTPNPMVLSGALGADLDAPTRIRLADSLGWPTDFAAWRRLLVWLLADLDWIPEEHLRDVIALFEIWQSAAADVDNRVSQSIVERCTIWLIDIEAAHSERRLNRRLPASPVTPERRLPFHLESQLRALVVRAARAYPSVVSRYLTAHERSDRRDEDAYQQIATYSPILARTHPVALAAISRRYLLEELPDASYERWMQEARDEARRRAAIQAIPPDQRSHGDQRALSLPPAALHRSFSSHDWDRLCIGLAHHGYFPASPVREPFHSLLEHAPETGLALVREVASHATSAWRQLHRHLDRRVTPVPLTVAFPWGSQEFWGEDRHYLWFRGHGGPQAVECALMALERWAIKQLDAGSPLDSLIESVLRGHCSLGVLGIAVHLAVRARQPSPATLALISSQRIWHLDLQRLVQESSLASAGMLGFDSGLGDASHRQAAAQLSRATSRRQDIRGLVPLFVLSTDVALQTACRSALERFPHVLELAYEEDKDDTARIESLRRTAELWAEFGKAENYSVEPVPDRANVVQVTMSSRRHDAPDVVATLQDAEDTAREVELWNWVESSFESNDMKGTLSIDDAVARAKQIDAASCEKDSSPPTRPYQLSDGAVAGTAAAVLCFAESSIHSAWAESVIDRYLVADDAVDSKTFPGSIIPWHPKIFVAFVLAARIQSGNARDGDVVGLFGLIAHKLEVVATSALGRLVGCWKRDRRLVWCGLGLALSLARFSRRQDLYRLDESEKERLESARRDAAAKDAIAGYRAVDTLPAWVQPSPSWIPPRSTPDGSSDLDGVDRNGWKRGDELWDGRSAAQTLQRAPISALMDSEWRGLFLNAIEGYLRWTLDTLNPSWRSDSGSSREPSEFHLHEWTDCLGRLVGSLCTYLPVDEALERYITPLLGQPDDIAIRLLSPLTTSIVCSGIFDAPEVRDGTLGLLHAVLDRVLKCYEFRRSRRRDGDLGGFGLSKIVDSMLLIVVEQAPGATRFANGNWTDIGQVMPLVDKVVRSAGSHPYVARAFVTLCDRAGAMYPTEAFAEQILVQLVDGGFPAEWKRTSIPAAIASLVQAHADHRHPLPMSLARNLLRILDALVDLGDRRSAALQQSEAFRSVRLANVS